MLGGKFSYSYVLLNRIFIDRDGDCAQTKTASQVIAGTFGAKIGRLFATDSNPSMQATAAISVKGTRTTGEYHNFADWKALIKNEVMRDSEQKWSLAHPLRSNFISPSGAASVSFRQKAHGASSRIGNALGMMHINNELPPSVNQKKRDKGSSNGSKIQHLSMKLVSRLDGPESASANSFKELAKNLYPKQGDALRSSNPDFNKSDLEVEKAMNAGQNDKIMLPAPGNFHATGGGKSLVKTEIELRAQVGVEFANLTSESGKGVRVGAMADIAPTASKQTVKFMRLKAPHELLDPGYNRSIGKTDELLGLLRGKTLGDKESPTVHYHKKIHEDMQVELQTNTPEAVSHATLARDAEVLFKKVGKVQDKYTALVNLADEH